MVCNLCCGLVWFSVHPIFFEFLGSLLTYLISPWNRALLEKLTSSQPIKNFPAFYGTRRFITAFTSARQLFLFWARSIQSLPHHFTSWRSILILSSHLLLRLTICVFPAGLLTKPPVAMNDGVQHIHSLPAKTWSRNMSQQKLSNKNIVQQFGIKYCIYKSVTQKIYNMQWV